MRRIASFLAAAMLCAATTAAAVAAPKQDEWGNMVDKMVKMGAEGHRSCNGKSGRCVTFLAMRSKDGGVMMLKTENAVGATIARELCAFNGTFDRMNCVDYDTKSTRVGVRDTDTGEWSLTSGD